MVCVENVGWFLAMGNKRITEPRKDSDELIELIAAIPWDIIMNVIIIVSENIYEQKETEKGLQ